MKLLPLCIWIIITHERGPSIKVLLALGDHIEIAKQAAGTENTVFYMKQIRIA
jgi:hypothetical protein